MCYVGEGFYYDTAVKQRSDSPRSILHLEGNPVVVIFS